MTDLVFLKLLAGDGGPGRVSFRREKYVPKGGPDGGNGGNGGDIILEADSGLAALDLYAGKTGFTAQSGEAGGKRKKTGANAEDFVLKVPVGTQVWLLGENSISWARRSHANRENNRFIPQKTRYYLEKEGQPIPPAPEQIIKMPLEIAGLSQKQLQQQFRSLEKEKLVVLDEPGMQFVLCKGGQGGTGNEQFKSSRETTPLFAEYGSPGEAKMVALELKLLADIGFVGFPNAGKSTLLSVLTKARPKVANYPFTTLEPQLGVLEPATFGIDDAPQLVVADIPGLIEGANQGKGLGHDFLRHIENCQRLLVVLALDDQLAIDQSVTDEQKIAELKDQHQRLLQELGLFSELLLAKPQLLAINKTDLWSASLRDAVSVAFPDAVLISAATKLGLKSLVNQLLVG